MIAFARGKIKNAVEILVGDMVEVEKQGRSYVIEKVLPRKNSLIRPYVANIDIAIITIALSPKPDYILVDKILLNCRNCNIKPVLCVNKSDLATDEFRKEIEEDYANFCDIIYVSAKNNENIDEIERLVKDKVVCLCGQSAVGKSSIINRLLPDASLEVGELSKKTERGKHTTRTTEIFRLRSGFVVDTCGFTMLENVDISERELQAFYPDFTEASYNCKFRGCEHIHEPECEVKRLVNEGKISKRRYERYVQIYGEIKENRRKKYE